MRARLVNGLCFLAITAILLGIAVLIMLLNHSKAAGHHSTHLVTGIIALAACCSLIGVITASVGLQNLYNISLSDWTNLAGFMNRAGFALAITCTIFVWLHLIQRVVAMFVPSSAPKAAPEVPAAAAAPAAPANTFTGSNPQHATV